MSSFDIDDGPAPAADVVDQASHALSNGRPPPSGMPAGMIKTQTEYQTAITVTKPRDLKDVERRVLAEAEQMGTDFVYAWRVNTKDKKLDEGDGKTTIEGLSIDGAMVLARNWGNCATPVRLEQESATHFLIRADFIDLETGFSFPRMYRQRKSGGPGGGIDRDRAEDIAFQIGQSKAQRNVVDKALPFWLRDRAIKAAKNSAAKKYTNVKEWAPKVIGSFAKTFKVEEKHLVKRIGRPVEQWTPWDILTLDILYRTLKDGETTLADEFEGMGPKEPSAASSDLEARIRAGETRPEPSNEVPKPEGAKSAAATPPHAVMGQVSVSEMPPVTKLATDAQTVMSETLRATIKAASTGAALSRAVADIQKAVRAQKITPAQHAELLKAVRHREELLNAPADSPPPEREPGQEG
jgi:hypothetical protein